MKTNSHYQTFGEAMNQSINDKWLFEQITDNTIAAITQEANNLLKRFINEDRQPAIIADGFRLLVVSARIRQDLFNPSKLELVPQFELADL